MSAAIVSALIAIGPGLTLAQTEYYEWIGRGGRSRFPSFGSAFFPKAALVAFSIPYLILALQLAFRRMSAGFVAVALGGIGMIGGALMLLFPSRLLIPYGVLWLSSLGALLGASIGVALAVVVIVGSTATFFFCQLELVRQGRVLDGSADIATGRGTAARPIAAAFYFTYAAVWYGSLVAPGSADEKRILTRAHEMAMAAAAQRGKLPAGSPLVLVRMFDPTPGAPPVTYGAAPALTVDALGNAYVASENALVAFDAAGRVRWRVDSVGSAGDAPALRIDPRAAGTVYVAGSNERLYAIRSQDGVIAWSRALNLPPVPRSKGSVKMRAPLLLDGGDILSGATSYDPRASIPLSRVGPDGSTRWRADVGQGIESAPVIGTGDTAYVLAKTPEPWPGSYLLHAVTADGRIAWQRRVGDGYYYDFLARADEGTLFVAGADLRVFSPEGTPLATVGSTASRSVIPLADHGLLSVGDAAVQYFQSDRSAKQWTLKWSYAAARIDADERIAGAILGSGGRVIVSTSSRVVVLRLADGHPLSEYAPLGEPGADGIEPPRLRSLSRPVQSPDGTIYVAVPGLRVYAFRDTTAR